MKKDERCIAIGCDHGGYRLKLEIIKYLQEQGIKYKDFGCDSESSVDYPIYAQIVSEAVASGACTLGILVCGTGIGMSIAANKVKGIRAACCTETYSAKMTRMHNDANILCIGGRVVGVGTALEMVHAFLHTNFEGGGRHENRIAMLEKEQAIGLADLDFVAWKTMKGA